MANPFFTPSNYKLPVKPVTSNELSALWNYTPDMQTASSTVPVLPQTQEQTLPNGGGTYNATGGAAIKPAPIFTGTPAAAAPVVPVAPAAPTNNFYDKYRDPKTGKIMTPEEYAIYLGNKIPKGNGEITNYAGDAVANPNQSAAELNARATDLNNSRNDIATGTTDPYKVGNQSGVAYSPAELKAIENAYAGVYDPALKDVFSRLEKTQAEEKAKTDLQTAKDLEVFKTNESIRQWRATTGTTKTGTKAVKDMFTQTQRNTAARNAGVSVSAIDDMDEDLVNFFISPKKATDFDGNTAEIGAAYKSWFDAVKNGDVTADEVADAINSTSLSPAVKTYYIDQIPAAPEKKKGWFTNVWNAVLGK